MSGSNRSMPSRQNAVNWSRETGIDIAVISDPVEASALIERWITSQDRADVRPGRGAGSSLLARAALRALLARNTGREDWRIVRGTFGKPFAIASSGEPGPEVSLSHSGGTVVVAMARVGALGIDIEQHRPRDFSALAAQAFGPEEQAEVAAHGEDAFYRIWTSREAMSKATGEGLALAANGRDLVAGGASGAYRRIEREGRVWDLTHARIEPGYSVAVAHANAGEKAWTLRWCDLHAIVP
jgi:4'-phosphopantetheinyl transferase